MEERDLFLSFPSMALFPHQCNDQKYYHSKEILAIDILKDLKTSVQHSILRSLELYGNQS